MKAILQHRFDPPLESKKMIVAGCILNPFPTEVSQCSSWGDSIVGDECLHVSKQQHDTINDFDKKKIFSAAVPKCKKVLGSPIHIFMRPIQKGNSHSSGDFSIVAKKVQNFPIKRRRFSLL
jgi:hypothetical protein